MHSALFVAIPKEQKDWHDFLLVADKKVVPNENILRLSENVWLIDATKELAAIGCLIAFADRYGIRHGILPFAQKPEWLPAGFYPKTSQGRN